MTDIEKNGCTGECESCSESCDTCQENENACSGSCETELWPKDDSGEPVPPVLLTTVTGTQVDYEMAISLLTSFGVPTLRDFPNAAALTKLIFGFAGTGMDVYVPANMIDFAREVIKPVDDAEEPAQ